MTWKIIESTKDFYDMAEKFREAIRELFGNNSSGGIGDQFGGLLMYVYLPAKANQVQPALGENLKRLAEALNNEALVEELALQARNNYRSRISRKIMEATRDLGIEVLFPLYEAAGIERKWTEIIYEHNDHRGSYGAETFLRKEVKNGITVSRVVKQIGKGRPAIYTKAKLEQMLRGAISRFRKRNYRSPSLPAVISRRLKCQKRNSRQRA